MNGSSSRLPSRWRIAVFLLCASPSLLAQGIKVSAPLSHARSAGEDVSWFQLAPDGRWAVYMTNAESDRFELYSVPVDGSATPRRLSGPLVLGGELRYGWLISPDGERVVYAGDQETDGVVELFVAPIDGGSPPIKVSGVLVAGGDVLDYFQITSDGSRVVYVADGNRNDRFALFSARLDGQGSPIALSGLLEPGADVDERLHLSPDGRTAVFLADRDLDDVNELWASPVTGGVPPRKLNGALVAGGDVTRTFEVSPDGARVIYIADGNTDGVNELYAVALDGSAPAVRLNAPLVAGGDVDHISAFAVSSDGSMVVYRADQDVDEVFELYSVAITGGTVRQLNAALPPGGDVDYDFAISPDGARVVYGADQASDEVVELYSVPIDASAAPLVLNPVLVEGGDVVPDFQLSPDGSRVVYIADQELDQVHELWVVPLDGSSAATRLNDVLAPGYAVASFRISRDGELVAYRADQRSNDVLELWCVPLDRSRSPELLSGPLGTVGDVSGGDFTSDSLRVVYVADQGVDEQYRLWSVPVDRSLEPVELNQALDGDPVVGDVSEFAWSPDGGRLVYAADEDWTELRAYPFVGVYSADVRELAPGRIPVVVLGSGEVSAMPAFLLGPAAGWVAFRETTRNPPAELISGHVVTTSIVGGAPLHVSSEQPGVADRFRFSPDGSRIVFYQYSPIYSFPPYGQGLFGIPSDASASPLCLSEPPGLQLDLEVRRFAFDPGSTRVVFVADFQGVHLYSSPLDGSGPAVELNEPFFDPGQDVLAFQLVPAGDAVVFVADASSPGVFELLRAPLGGGAPPVRLGVPPVSGGGVDPGFRLTSESVIYAADYEKPGELELWSAPLDPAQGGQPVRLSPDSVAGGGLAPSLALPAEDGFPDFSPQFQVSLDGARVVYRADQEVDEVYELFSVPSDGSAPPVRLHGPLGPAQDAEPFGFRITPDARHVVFAADLERVDVVELFLVPVEGNAPPLRISGPCVPGGGLWTRSSDGAGQSFVLTPDGSAVVYLADRRVDDVFELFLAPLDGSRPPRRLSSALVAGGDVSRPEPGLAPAPFALSPDGTLVAYIADQEVDEVFELFVSYLEPPRSRAPRVLESKP